VPTIEDVARAAGVSLSTVSYALSGKRRISEATRLRVERAARELGYRPHAGARALASSRSDVIALAVPFRPGLDVQIVMQFVAGVVAAARTHGRDVLLLTADDPEEVARVAASSTADAVVVMDVASDDARLPALRALPVPSVLIGVPDDTRGLSCVDLDFTAAGRLAVSTLAEAGHTTIALVSASATRLAEGANYAVRMRAGALAGAAAHGVELLQVPSEPTFAGGAAAVQEAFARGPRPTALVVHNEAALGGVVSALERLGLRVPADVSVVAVAPSEIAAALPIRLTTVEVPGQRIGRIAVEMAMQRMGGDDTAETRLVAPALLDPEVSVARCAAQPA